MRGNAYIVVNRGAAGTEWKGRAPQAQIGSGGGLFPPPLLRGDARGTSHAASKVIARALQRGGASLYIYTVVVSTSYVYK